MLVQAGIFLIRESLDVSFTSCLHIDMVSGIIKRNSNKSCFFLISKFDRCSHLTIRELIALTENHNDIS